MCLCNNKMRIAPSAPNTLPAWSECLHYQKTYIICKTFREGGDCSSPEKMTKGPPHFVDLEQRSSMARVSPGLLFFARSLYHQLLSQSAPAIVLNTRGSSSPYSYQSLLLISWGILPSVDYNASILKLALTHDWRFSLLQMALCTM